MALFNYFFLTFLTVLIISSYEEIRKNKTLNIKAMAGLYLNQYTKRFEDLGNLIICKMQFLTKEEKQKRIQELKTKVRADYPHLSDLECGGIAKSLLRKEEKQIQ